MISIHTTVSVVTNIYKMADRVFIISIHTTVSVVTDYKERYAQLTTISIHTTVSVVTRTSWALMTGGRYFNPHHCISGDCGVIGAVLGVVDFNPHHCISGDEVA